MQRSWAKSTEGRAAARGGFSDGFSDRFGRAANEAANRVLKLCEQDVEDLREQHARRRDPDEVQAAIDALGKAKGEAGDLAEALRKQSFREGKVAAAKDKALELLGACVRLCDEAVAYLKKGDGARKADERALRDRFDKVDDLKHEFRQLLFELPKKWISPTPVNASLFKRTKAAVEKNPELRPAWDKAVQDGVLTWDEAKDILERAGEKVGPDE
jgi:hypothetical protein